MGTTQRILPGVPGQPNWGDLNKSVTNIAKTVEKEAKEYRKLIDRRNYHLKATFKNLVKTGGGSKSISSGKSSSIGKAGLKSSSKLVRFFSNVGSGGLQYALTDLGFGSLAGKNIKDVIDFLLVYCSDTNTGMDETAANKASCEVLKEIAEQSSNNLDAFEKLLKEYVEGKGLADLLCNFWGYYIFEHLSQRFQEKITQQRSEAVSSETFKIIKDDILGRIKVLNENRPVTKIDWKGAEGKKEIESIFESIIKIICDENND
jgi:hypothetical protein